MSEFADLLQSATVSLHSEDGLHIVEIVFSDREKAEQCFEELAP